MADAPLMHEVKLGSAPDRATVEADLNLAHAILAGDEAAWHEFIQRYTGLIRAVIRRYLHARDVDTVQTIYADTLEAIYRHKLRTYEGRASLATWLTLVARCEVMDHLRRRFGRRVPPRGLHRLAAIDRRIFRLYYVDGRAVTEVLGALEQLEPGWTLVRLTHALQRIENVLDDRWLQRLAYDLHAQSTGAASGRLLEYLDHVRSENQLNPGAFSPEYHLMERQAQRMVERVQALIRHLPDDERRLLEFRFEKGWTARRIADELGLGEPRAVYTVIDRVVRRLRRLLT